VQFFLRYQLCRISHPQGWLRVHAHLCWPAWLFPEGGVQFSAFRFDVFLTAFQLVSVLCWIFLQNLSFVPVNFSLSPFERNFSFAGARSSLNAGKSILWTSCSILLAYRNQYYCPHDLLMLSFYYFLTQRAYQSVALCELERQEARTAHWFVL